MRHRGGRTKRYRRTCTRVYMCTRQIARNCRPFVCKSIQRSPSAPPILVARGAHRERQEGALSRSPLKLRATSVVRRSQRWFTRPSTEQRDRGMKQKGKRGAHPSRIREARVGQLRVPSDAAAPMFIPRHSLRHHRPPSSVCSPYAHEITRHVTLASALKLRRPKSPNVHHGTLSSPALAHARAIGESLAISPAGVAPKTPRYRRFQRTRRGRIRRGESSEAGRFAFDGLPGRAPRIVIKIIARMNMHEQRAWPIRRHCDLTRGASLNCT